MSKLIDRSNLKMEIKKWLKPSAADESTMVALDDIAISVLMTIEEQPLVQAIPLDKVKQAREEIDDLDRHYDNDYFSSNRDAMFKCNEVLEILDKLLESEE